MPTTGEIRIKWGIVLISAVKITSGRIGLPDFDERVRHWAGIFIEHSPTHDDAFAKRFARMLPRQVAGFHIDNSRFEDRTRNLRKRVRKSHKSCIGARFSEET